MNVADELQKLQQLHQSGAINDEEFTLAKAKLLSGQPGATPDAGGISPATLEQQTRQWAMFIHFSVLANYVLPPAGLVLPIVLWQVKKAELPGIEPHGKNALNWVISKIIYLVICVVLSFVIIGIPLLIALGVIGVIFPVVAAIKANQGEVWKYPLAIPFLN
jgi:uncharacterized Tic20 family protein